MTPKGRGPQSRKRKLSDSALPVAKGNQAKFLTPQTHKKGKTPQKSQPLNSGSALKHSPKGKTPVSTPKQNTRAKPQPTPKGAKSTNKNTPKGKSPTSNGKPAKAMAEDSDEEEGDSDDGEENVLNLPKDSKSKLFAGQLQEDDDDDDDEDNNDDEDDDDEENDDDNDEEEIEDDDDEEEDDDEEGDDDEDDDIENEDDEEEEEEPVAPLPKKVKANDQSPVKKQTRPLPESNKKNVQENNKAKKELTSPQENKNNKTDDRDSRTLFVKNLPADCSVKQLKSLSKDIKQVRLRAKTLFNRKTKQKERTGFAFLEFESEAAAESNMKSLKSSYIEGRQLIIDYVGEKSQHDFAKKKVGVEEYDPQKLYVAGLADDMTEADLRKLFPKASDVILLKGKDKKLYGYAFVKFSSPEVAKLSHDKMQDKKFKGRTLIVLYAKKRKMEEKQKQKQQKEANKAKAKKQATQETSMDVDDDDDDEEEEEDDDSEEDNVASKSENVKQSVKGMVKSRLVPEEDEDDDEDDDDDEEEDDDDDEEQEEEVGDNKDDDGEDDDDDGDGDDNEENDDDDDSEEDDDDDE